ncbi:MAG TPA: ABC transporter permease [Actinospica sp.]|jgi:peptide/nickel transport system permease protein|nr:ABC transporter permease [Actinospica sp.]
MTATFEEDVLPPEHSAVELGLESAEKPRSMLRRGWEVFVENRLALVSLIFLVLFCLFVYLGPLFYHGDAYVSNLDAVDLAPGAGHPLGTDPNGEDVLAQFMHGGQISINVGVLSGLISAVVGTLYGAVAGYVGGWVDALMMRAMDAMLSIPLIFLLIYLGMVYGHSTTLMVLVIGFTGWFGITRLIRGEAMTIKVRDYVAAARMMGGRGPRVIWKHILPNSIGTTMVNTTFSIAGSIFYLSTLSFIGLGLQVPNVDLGGILNTGTQYVDQGYWWLIYPAAIAIILVILAFNVIGDALRDAFETRLQKR